MSVILEMAREKVKKDEDFLAKLRADKAAELNPAPELGGSWSSIEWAEKALASSKKRLEILEKSDLDKTANEMKAILSHAKAVEEKYECRSVKGMFWLARFASFFSKSLGQRIQNYTVKEIHAPVCSIVSSPKPELPPMPVVEDSEMVLRKQRAVEELKKFQSLTQDWMTYKPSRWELFKLWLGRVKEVFTIRKGEPILSEYERMEQKQKAVLAGRVDLTQKGKV